MISGMGDALDDRRRMKSRRLKVSDGPSRLWRPAMHVDVAGCPRIRRPASRTVEDVVAELSQLASTSG